ncbi:HAMP domain-containing histidine kinase [Thermoactinomyces sp. AMNI-1]|uniref:histidine kinase n=2 Tax=Thermoactinomyces mirandus TaxID=2756294 RepID=A0A7W1XTR9_9BACL|nr:HAMP domain-containing histidine kinase [Thermoactinomyces mirandus]
MLEKKSLKTQFIITFVLIILLSIIATIVTYFAGFILFTQIEYKKVYPANYPEKMIPDLEDYIRREGTLLLNKRNRNLLEQRVPSKVILYQVVDENGEIIYGTEHHKILNGKEDLYNKVNTTIKMDGRYAKMIPVFNSRGKISGAISLSYAITPYYPETSDKIWFTFVFMVIIFSPFIYIVVFTFAFSRILAKNTGKPVNMLIDAIRKVKEKDLDFDLDYRAENELGKLCEAFDEMKNELKKSLMSQWKAEQERQEMVQALAHDMKTPLSVIQGYTESLLDNGSGNAEQTANYLRVIKEKADQASELIREILYAMELERSGEDIHAVSIDIRSFLMKKKESYEMISRDKKIVFEVNVSCQNRGEAIFPVDVGKLDRILDNVISNSIRYTPENGRIRINADMARDRIHFKICDTGKGFSRKDLSNLFRKFYKGDEARSHKNGHVGLGLYIAKKLVEMHGGSIAAFNDNDRGACVAFDLPFIRNNDNGEI